VSSFAARTDVGQVRAQNQDEVAAALLPDGSVLLAVADGVAGSPGGEVASKTAIEVLVAVLREGGNPELERAVSAANEAVVELQPTRKEWQHMATTLVAAVIADSVATVANVGDSRAYALIGGELRQISRDDSWVADAVESGEFTLEEAERHSLRNVVTKVIGMPGGAEPAVHQIRLSPGDAVLLATDGLFKMLPDEDIARAIAGTDNAESAAAALVDAANAAGGMDNIGVALYRA
jgi:PPM family protein phosphatase